MHFILLILAIAVFLVSCGTFVRAYWLLSGTSVLHNIRFRLPSGEWVNLERALSHVITELDILKSTLVSNEKQLEYALALPKKEHLQNILMTMDNSLDVFPENYESMALEDYRKTLDYSFESEVELTKEELIKQQLHIFEQWQYGFDERPSWRQASTPWTVNEKWIERACAHYARKHRDELTLLGQEEAKKKLSSRISFFLNVAETRWSSARRQSDSRERTLMEAFDEAVSKRFFRISGKDVPPGLALAKWKHALKERLLSKLVADIFNDEREQDKRMVELPAKQEAS